jgi:putative endonuclease
MFYVYLIISLNIKQPFTYVGYTNNLRKRLNLHNSGLGAKFTRGRKWKIIYKKRYNNKSIAMKEEYKLKKNYNFRAKIKKQYLKNEFL